MPYTVYWGILATGIISTKFTKDLLRGAHTRGEDDIIHKVVAVGSSSGVDRAKQFIKDCGLSEESTKAYGDYNELVKDTNVKVAYIGTPHSHHYANVKMCLEAGLHVLCEKAFTTNTKQAEALIEMAKEKKLFLMEAFWTRFFPASKRAVELIQKGEIGEVKAVEAQLNRTLIKKDTPNTHRLLNPELAGGALLDLGVYPIHWAFTLLYHAIPRDTRTPPNDIQASTEPYGETKVDNKLDAWISWPHGAKAHCLSSMTDHEDESRPTIWVKGTKGMIGVAAPAFAPLGVWIEIEGQDQKREEFPLTDGNTGMGWEADEVGRCIRDGKLESEEVTWAETIEVMKVCDEIRRQNGVTFPDSIETL